MNEIYECKRGFFNPKSNLTLFFEIKKKLKSIVFDTSPEIVKPNSDSLNRFEILFVSFPVHLYNFKS